MFIVRSIPSVVTWQKIKFARRVARILQTSNTDNVLVGEPDMSLFVRLWNRSKDNSKRICNKARVFGLNSADFCRAFLNAALKLRVLKRGRMVYWPGELLLAYRGEPS